MSIRIRLVAIVMAAPLVLLSMQPSHAQQKFNYDGPVITLRLSHFAPEVPMGQIFCGVMPFLVGEFVLIGLLVIFPGIATWLPQMMK